MAVSAQIHQKVAKMAKNAEFWPKIVEFCKIFVEKYIFCSTNIFGNLKKGGESTIDQNSPQNCTSLEFP